MVHGFPGWLMSAEWRTKAKALDFSILKSIVILSATDWFHSLFRHAEQTLHRLQLGKMGTHICGQDHFNHQMSKISKRFPLVHRLPSSSASSSGHVLVFIRRKFREDIVIIDSHQAKCSTNMMVFQNSTIVVDQRHVRSDETVH